MASLKPDRGDATKERLLNAAVAVFGRRGFDGSTTRMLADAAGVNQQAIPYYFGSKHDLYVAAAEHIGAMASTKTSVLRQELSDRLARAEEAGDLISEAEARQLLGTLLLASTEMLISDESEPWAWFIVREQIAPTEAFERIYEAVMRPAIQIAMRLVGIILKEETASERVQLHTLSLIGGVLVFRTARATTLRVMQWDRIGSLEGDAIRGHVKYLVASLK